MRRAAGPGRHGGGASRAAAAARRPPPVSRLAHRLEVEPDREVRALGGDDDDPHRRVGRSARPWPGAGPATGPRPWRCGPRRRSSHTVATASSSCSMRQHRRLEIGDLSHAPKANPPGGDASRGPVECMGHIGNPERGLDPAHLHRRGVRGPGRTGLAPRAAGRRLRGLRLDPAALGERGGLALHAHRRPGPRRFRPAGPTTGRPRAGDQLLAALTTALGPVAGSVLVHNGRAGTFTMAGPAERGLAFGRADDVAGSSDMLGSVQQGGDALVRLNDAFVPDPVFVDVPAGVTVDAPVLVVHWCDPASSAFPRTSVRAGEGAARVRRRGLRRRRGCGRASLVVPVTELAAADGASLVVRVAADPRWRGLVDRPAGRPWRRRLVAAHLHRRPRRLLRPGARRRLGRRARTPAARSSRPISATGPRCTTSAPCRTTWRPRTTSELLCQGAVAGTSRSVYSGLIRVHRGAVRSDARQTNHNLVLDEGAHADSVPNLDILENDVKLLPRLDGGADRRGPALLHRVARRGARGGRGAHRARLLRRHHRPVARSRGRSRSCSARCTSVSTSRWAAERLPAGV